MAWYCSDIRAEGVCGDRKVGEELAWLGFIDVEIQLRGGPMRFTIIMAIGHSGLEAMFTINGRGELLQL